MDQLTFQLLQRLGLSSTSRVMLHIAWLVFLLSAVKQMVDGVETLLYVRVRTLYSHNCWCRTVSVILVV